METTQTAVEWLVKEFNLEEFKASVELAKAKEKEQIIDAYWNGTVDIDKKYAILEAEEFYNETYNK
jgi:hypothetical protein